MKGNTQVHNLLFRDLNFRNSTIYTQSTQCNWVKIANVFKDNKQGIGALRKYFINGCTINAQGSMFTYVYIYIYILYIYIVDESKSCSEGDIPV